MLGFATLQQNRVRFVSMLFVMNVSAIKSIEKQLKKQLKKKLKKQLKKQLKIMSRSRSSPLSESEKAFSPAGKTNVVLIGMPGSGKSTSGVLLAKSLGLSFLDTDLLIQQQAGALLQDLVDEEGFSGFIDIEETIVSRLEISKSVISTGGSVVYSEKAMSHFKDIGTVVYLEVSFPEITRRIQNISTRGIALKAGQNLEVLYNERLPLYRKHADITVYGDGKTIEELVTEIARYIQNGGPV